MFDHANVNKTGAWEEFEKQLRSAMETKSVESQVRVKPTAGHSHFPQGPGQKSSWIFELKRTHIHMLHYPEVLDGSAGWHEETNMHRSLYYAAMQQHLHTMLAKNFEEYEKSIFEKYNPQNDVSEADAALLGRAVTRHIVEADQPAGALWRYRRTLAVWNLRIPGVKEEISRPEVGARLHVNVRIQPFAQAGFDNVDDRVG